MGTDADPDRDPGLQRLLDQALDDLRSGWDRGGRIPVENFLDRDPALRDDAEAMLDLIYQEFTIRRELGENPDPNEFTARFPDLAGPILLQFGLDAAVTMKLEPPAQDDPEPVPPERIGDYEVISVLGRGNMGVVYKARHREIDHVVAIKMMIEGRYASPEQRERFRSEARAVARLKHPNIIDIHQVGEHEDRPYLSLEFAEGGGLAQRLVDRPMAPREAAGLVEVLARAVHAAHQAGVVHRDLKPSNILLTAEGIPKIADFGLAKLLDSDSAHTLSGQVVGTPSYMAPEQAQGQSKRVGPAADVYALGAIIYHALTGRPPFLGESALETIRLATTTEAVSPRRLRPDVPRDLETICLKCLAKEPLKRYSSASALAEDLHRYLQDRPIVARPVGPVTRLWRWSRRNPSVAGLSAAVFISLVLGTIVSVVQAIRATRAEAVARQQRDRAEAESRISRAVQEFVEQGMLAQASVYNQWPHTMKPDRDLKVRTMLDQGAGTIGGQFTEQPLVEASIRRVIGETYHQLGLYQQALPHLRRALEIRRGVLGEGHPDTLLSMRALGRVYLDDGKLSDAGPLLIAAMEGLRRSRGVDHPDALDATVLVAELDYTRQEYDEAERLLDEARRTYLAMRGKDDPKTLEVTNGLGLVYLQQGKGTLAEQTLVDVLGRARRIFGTEHPFTLLVEENLSDVFEYENRKDEAVNLLVEAISGQTKALGRNHPETLHSMVKLGMLYGQMDMLDKAEPLLSEALAGCRAALDRNHETTVNALAGLSVVYVKKNDMKELGRVLIQTVEITRFRWGDDHLDTAFANQIAGMFHLNQRQYEKAESYLRDCVAYWVKNNPGDESRFFNELQYGIALLAQGKYAEARTHFLDGYNGWQPGQQDRPRPEHANLGEIIERVTKLRTTDGQPLTKTTTLWALHRDPRLVQIVLDLQFPPDPFAPP